MYTLQFVPAALEEWNALDGSIKEILRTALRKRLEQPKVPGSALRGKLAGCYKIKLLKQGYRLVYEVLDTQVVVLVLAVNKREDALAYLLAEERR
jgi:mRNA interferase RelE/StbE